MDLTALKPIDLRKRLYDQESQAITVRKRRNNGLVRLGAGVGVAGTTAVAGMYVFLALVGAIMPLPLFLALTVFLLGSTAITLTVMASAWRFIEPPERKLLTAISEPDAAEFLDDNWLRRERLLAEASAFDEALEAFKALPERAGGDEIDEGVIANLIERRARIEAEIETYLAQFRKATEVERRRVAAANVRRKRLPSPHRQSMRDYRRKVKMLRRLEASLDDLLDSGGAATDVDLSPYQAALRFRAELEEERASLIRCGFRPGKLPKPPGRRKLLGP